MAEPCYQEILAKKGDREIVIKLTTWEQLESLRKSEEVKHRGSVCYDDIIKLLIKIAKENGIQ